MPQPGSQPGTQVLTPKEAAAGGYVMGPAGFYLTPQGDLAPGQITPGAAANPSGQTLYDAAKDLNYNLINGHKVYQSPVAYTNDANPQTIYKQSLHGPAISDTGGGIVHGGPKWNTQTGKWDVGLDWGKILAIAAAGGIGAGGLSAAGVLGGASVGAGAASTLPATATVPATGALAGGVPSGLLSASGAAAAQSAAAAGLLPSTTIGTGAIGPVAGGTGITSGGGGVSILDTVKSVYDAYNKYKGVADAISSIGTAATGASAGRAQGRMSQAEIQHAQDWLAQSRYQNEAEAAASKNKYGLDVGRFGLDSATTDLAQRRFGLEAPGQRAGNAVRGDILSRAQDVAFSGLPSGLKVPTISGGLRPSMFSGATRALGTNMTDQALAAQQAGDKFAPLPTIAPYTAPPPVPGLTALPAAGSLDTILNTAGTVGTLADILAKYRRRPPTPAANLNDPNVFVGPTNQPTNLGAVEDN